MFATLQTLAGFPRSGVRWASAYWIELPLSALLRNEHSALGEHGTVAPPYRWYDAFLDAGWPDVLSRAALRLILAIGRRVDRHTRQTRMAMDRLQSESRLSARSFWRAKTELTRYGLVARPRSGKPRALALTFPVPTVPLVAERNATHGSKDCHPWQKTLPPVAVANGRKARRTTVSANNHPETKEPTEEETEAQIRVRALEKQAAIRLGLAPLPSWLLARVLRAVEVLQTSPARREEEGLSIALQLQAEGQLVPSAAVTEFLKDATALVDPMTVAAVELFNGEIIAVREVEA